MTAGNMWQAQEERGERERGRGRRRRSPVPENEGRPPRAETVEASLDGREAEFWSANEAGALIGNTRRSDGAEGEAVRAASALKRPPFPCLVPPEVLRQLMHSYGFSIKRNSSFSSLATLEPIMRWANSGDAKQGTGGLCSPLAFHLRTFSFSPQGLNKRRKKYCRGRLL